MSVHRRASLPLLAILFAVGACHSEPDSPEAQIRAVIARGEKAVEEKDIGTVKELISEQYHDGNKLDRRTVVGLVLRQFMAHKSIHLLIKISSIEIAEPGHGHVVLFAAIAGRPIPSPAELATLKADLYRFEFDFDEESARDWKLTSASWRPAEIEDLS